MKKRLVFLLAACSFACIAKAQQPILQPLLLYPNGTPESNGLSRDSVRLLPDTAIIQGVDADYFLFPPNPAKATGQAILICPGGGYWGCWFGHEGLAPARWMQERGIYAVVLRYRMPNGHYEIPLKDVQATLRLIRSNAKKWGIDPHQVGVMGFSAGGHLAASASTLFIDSLTRPDWTILGYPVITFDLEKTHQGTRFNLIGKDASETLIERYSLEKQVTERTPSTFMMMASDDKTVPTINATLYYNALIAHHVPAELHMYPSGGHGFGWNAEFKYHNELMNTLDRWLKEQNCAAKQAKKR